MNGKLVLGALGGIGLIATVSVVSFKSGSSDPSWTKGIPPFSFLSANKAFMDKQQDDRTYRFGYIYSELLVGDVDTNNGWWKWSYENLKEDLKKQDTPSADAFNVVQTSSQIPNSAESLKAWCNAAYQVNMRSQNPFDAPGSIFNNESIWKYCSPIQKVPVSLKKSEVTYPEGTAGNQEASVLLDTNKNERIWYYRNKFFEEKNENFFKEKENHDAFVQGKKKGRKVRDICVDAYDQKLEEEDSIHSDVKFFCSISNLI